MNNPKLEFTKSSGVILGGVPLTMQLPSQFSATPNYTGCLDDLQVNYHFVGTWNADVSNNTKNLIKITVHHFYAQHHYQE